MSRSPIFALISLATLMSVSTLSAANVYCSVIDGERDCQYYTWQQCKDVVGDKGRCSLNTQGAVSPSPSRDSLQQQGERDYHTRHRSGQAPYCVRSQHGTQCHYHSFEACQKAATAQGGTCQGEMNLEYKHSR